MLRTLIASAALIATLATTSPASTQADHADKNERLGPVVTVRGSATAAGEPDRVRIAFGVTHQATNAAAAQARTSATANAIIDAVNALELPNAVLQTQGVYVNPIYNQRNRDGSSNNVTSYRAGNTVTLRFDDVTRAGEAIDVAIRAGANQVNSLSLEMQDDTALRAAAIGDAASAARDKATIIAGSLGMQLGSLIEIREEGAAPSFPRFESRDMVASSAAIRTPVEGGEVSVRASVVATYELRTDGAAK